MKIKLNRVAEFFITVGSFLFCLSASILFLMVMWAFMITEPILK